MKFLKSYATDKQNKNNIKTWYCVTAGANMVLVELVTGMLNLHIQCLTEFLKMRTQWKIAGSYFK